MIPVRPAERRTGRAGAKGVVARIAAGPGEQHVKPAPQPHGSLQPLARSPRASGQNAGSQGERQFSPAHGSLPPPPSAARPGSEARNQERRQRNRLRRL